jgi:hypothetical protein
MDTKKSAPKFPSPATASLDEAFNSHALVNDVRSLITAAQAGLAATVNSTLTMLYWRIGQRIRFEVLTNASVPVTVSRLLNHWRDNWKPDTGAALAAKTCGTCCALPRSSRPKTLSTH